MLKEAAADCRSALPAELRLYYQDQDMRAARVDGLSGPGRQSHERAL